MHLGRGNKNKNSTSQGLCKQSNECRMKGRPGGTTLTTSGRHNFPRNVRERSFRCIWKCVHIKAVTSQLSNGVNKRTVWWGEWHRSVCTERKPSTTDTMKTAVSTEVVWPWGRPRGTDGSCPRERLLQAKLRITLFIRLTCCCYPKAGQKQLKSYENLERLEWR